MAEKTIFGIDDMVDAIAEELQGDESNAQSIREVSKKAIKAVIKAEQSLIVGAVANGDKVSYIGFGGFEARERSARKGRNPQNGEEIQIPASTVPAFKAGKAFKDAVK